MNSQKYICFKCIYDQNSLLSKSTWLHLFIYLFYRCLTFSSGVFLGDGAGGEGVGVNNSCFRERGGVIKKNTNHCVLDSPTLPVLNWVKNNAAKSVLSLYRVWIVSFMYNFYIYMNLTIQQIKKYKSTRLFHYTERTTPFRS